MQDLSTIKIYSKILRELVVVTGNISSNIKSFTFSIYSLGLRVDIIQLM